MRARYKPGRRLSQQLNSTQGNWESLRAGLEFIQKKVYKFTAFRRLKKLH